MKKWKEVLLVIFLVYMISGACMKVKAADMVSFPIKIQENYDMANRLIVLINKQRIENDLPPYRVDPGLTEYAMKRATECQMMYGHASPNPDSADKDDSTRYGECIGIMIGLLPEKCLEGWQDGSHLPSILSARDEYCGVGCVTYNGVTTWTLMVYKEPRTIECSVPDSGCIWNERKIDFNVTQWIANTVGYKFDFYRPNRTIIYGNSNDTVPIYIKDPFRNNSCGTGYIPPAEMLTYTVSDPDIFSIDSNTGCIIPHKKGKADLTVTLKENPVMTSTIPITVKPCNMGSYTDGSVTYKWQFIMPDGSLSDEEGKTTYTEHYTGKEICPKVVVKSPFGAVLTEGVDYRLVYSNHIEPGFASIKLYTRGNYSSAEETFFLNIHFQIIESVDDESNLNDDETSKEPEREPAESQQTQKVLLKLSKYIMVYTGSVIGPSVSVYVGNKLLNVENYRLTFKNNRNIGYATVTMTGKGKYKACTATTVYKIIPKREKIVSVKSKKEKKITIKWRKDISVDGFQIQISPHKRFKSGIKELSVKGKKKTTVTIKRPISKKNWYVRVRGYKHLSDETWYGAWSRARRVKVK